MYLPFYKIKLVLFALLCISSLSCKKFLQSYSQNDSFINTADDLEELLVADGYFEFFDIPFSPVLFEMDDDVKAATFARRDRFAIPNGYYNWSQNPRVNSEGQLAASDVYYTKFYLKIARLNTILGSISTLRGKGESEARLNKIAGEAHFLRAYYYHFLVNAFGKPYKVSTAVTDYGVPLKTEAAIKEQFVSRATTAQVYNQMVEDLLLADKLLQGSNETSRIRANRSSVHTLLSRVYLYMSEYEQAVHYADLAISNRTYTLTDLSKHTANTDYLTVNSPEVQFTMGYNSFYNRAGLEADEPLRWYCQASDELVGVYETNDLRKETYFVKNSKGAWKFGKKRNSDINSMQTVGEMFLIRLAEAYLNKAEALALLGRTEDARSCIQEFRRTRFGTSDLPALTKTGGELVNFIRDERRRELVVEGHRWFDLRRYAVNADYPFTKTIRHRNISFSGTGYVEDGYYELDTYHNEPGAYVLPIAVDEIEFNQGLLQNEDRPERPLKH